MTKQLRKLLLLFAAVLLANSGYAEVEVDGIYYNLNKEDMTAEVTYKGSGQYDYDEYTGNITIPATITYQETNYIVTRIGVDAFIGNSGLTSVNIPASVTSIDITYCNHPFDGCEALTAINVSSGNPVYSSVDGVLYNKGKTVLVAYPEGMVGAFTIPSSVTSIGGSAFRLCRGLTSVTIPSSVTSIGEYAFEFCSGLTSVIIPSSVTSIGYGAFQRCSGLTSVTIPSSVTSIGASAFQRCSGLTSVTIPSSVTSIGASAFRLCRGLTSVTIPSSVTSIELQTFDSCSGLTSVTIPSSVTSIGYEAFSGCSGLTSITIPSSVTSIGEGAFKYCSGLTSVTIPPSVASISDEAFNRCHELTSITIPSSVTSIGMRAFENCYKLTSITIPSSVTYIGVDAFHNCSLKSLYLFAKLGDYDRSFRGMYSSVIFAYNSEIEKIQAVWRDKVFDIEKPYCMDVASTDIHKVQFRFIENEYVPATLQSVDIHKVQSRSIENGYAPATLQSVKMGNIEIVPDENGLYTATGLDAGATYEVVVTYKDAAGDVQSYAQTFTTEEDLTGIGTVATEDPAAPTITGYYDMSGRKSATPRCGVNIVRYSDGTARKIVIR